MQNEHEVSIMPRTVRFPPNAGIRPPIEVSHSDAGRLSDSRGLSSAIERQARVAAEIRPFSSSAPKGDQPEARGEVHESRIPTERRGLGTENKAGDILVSRVDRHLMKCD